MGSSFPIPRSRSTRTCSGSPGASRRRRSASSPRTWINGASSARFSGAPMPLRIAIVSEAYHPAVGGVTEHVDATALALRARGHEVTVVTSRHPAAAPPGDGAGSEGSDGGREGVGVLRIGRNVVFPYNGAENNMTVGFGLRRKLETILCE